MVSLMNTDYGKVYTFSFEVVNAVTKTLHEAVCAVLEETDKNGAFTFCDFGTADCKGSSAQVAKEVLQQVRRFDPRREVSIVFEDQPGNDFRPAFLEVQKALCSADNGTPDQGRVLLSAVGRSFFDRCLPTNSLHLGVSLLAAHFLNVTDSGNTVGYSFPLLRSLRANDNNVTGLTETGRSQVEAIARKGAADWEQFLLCRGEELAVGGRLIVCAISDVESEPETEKSIAATTLDGILWIIADAVHELVEAGEITEKEENLFVSPRHRRSLEDVKAPFLNERSPVRQVGLRIVELRKLLVKRQTFFSYDQSPESLSDEEMKKYGKDILHTNTRCFSRLD